MPTSRRLERNGKFSLAAAAGSLFLSLLAISLVAEAQQVRRPIIGVTLVHPPPSPYGEALRRGLADLGWVDGQNVRIEYRYAEGRPERYPGFFAELLRLNADVIVAGGGTPAARGGQASDEHDPDRHFRERCGRFGFRGEPGSAGRQRHRVFDSEHGNQRDTAALAQGGIPAD